MNKPLLLALATSLAISCITARAEEGVSAGEVVIGMVNQVTGPIAPSCASMNAGLKVYFDRLNARGGVFGRKIRVIGYDDVYDPVKTVALTEKLIDQDHVFALMNYNGTPTVKSVMPMVKNRQVPLLFSRTGEPSLRKPPDPNLVNIRGTFNEELAALLARMVEKEGKKSFALFAQADAFGTANRAAAQRYLSAHGISLKAEGSISRSSADIEAAYRAISAANPEVVIFGVTLGAIIPILKKAKAEGKPWIFISTSSNSSMMDKLGAGADGVILSQVVPDFDSDLELARQFKADMKAAGKEKLIDPISWETYIDAAVFEAGLRRAGNPPTREGLRKAFQNTSYELGGLKLKFSPETEETGTLPLHLAIVRGGKLIDY